jgi:hypothetical protein
MIIITIAATAATTIPRLSKYTSCAIVALQFICYDIDFKLPATGLWASGVRNFVYNTEWLNSPLNIASTAQGAWFVRLIMKSSSTIIMIRFVMLVVMIFTSLILQNNRILFLNI